MGNMSPYYFKTIFRQCIKHIPSFIKIGGAVSEKNGNPGHTFVVLYIGLSILYVVSLNFALFSTVATSYSEVTNDGKKH